MASGGGSSIAMAPHYTRGVDRRSRLVLLGVLGGGVFLAGLELMVTAVALPSIVNDLASWTELRQASWVINGYLLAYVVTMPLAGRLADQWGVRRLFLLGLGVFTLGSLLAGLAPSLETLIGARVVQAVGGGILVPVGTAAAAHLFEDRARPRALGVIGALTFLGMAAGPFVGAWIIGGIHPAAALDGAGILDGPLRTALEASWRYVFYVNVPIGIAALGLAWAAAHAWETPRIAGRLDIPGALAFSIALGFALVAVTLAGSEAIEGFAQDPALLLGGLLVAALAAGVIAALFGLRHPAPFLDVRHFRSASFSSAALVSLLTGYGLATAIVGGAVFVDRVLYGGPDVQRVTLGALAGAVAIGALGSGLVLRVVGLRLVTVAGLALSTVALVRMSAWTPSTGIAEVAAWMGAFGLGFGLTVTPRSTAAIEALGAAAAGVASATVTVARMIGMAVGLAALTAFGSTTIDRLYREVYATPESYKLFIPEALRNRPLRDGQVVEALEAWASGEAARILVGIFLVAAVVTAVALVPALALGRRRILAPGTTADAPLKADETVGGIEPGGAA